MTKMICKDCGHKFINELVNVRQFGHGDNITEHVVCPDCGHTQKLPDWETKGMLKVTRPALTARTI